MTSIKEELNKIKGFDLVQIMVDDGAVINRAKSTRKHTVLNGPSGDMFVVSQKPNGHFMYFNSKGTDKGTVIDYMQHHNNLSFKQIIEKFHGKNYKSIPGREALSKGESELKSLLLPLKDTKYLNERGIDNTTLNNPLFIDRIYNSKFSSSSGKDYINTSFPMYKGGQVKSIDHRNFGLKSAEKDSDKSGSVWISQIPDKIDQIVLCESPIDCLSHFQLADDIQPKINKQNTLYISTGGTVHDTSIQEINKVFNKVDPNKEAKIWLANDSDRAGRWFDQKYLCQLDLVDKKEIIFKSSLIASGTDLEGGRKYTCEIACKTREDAKVRELQEAILKAGGKESDLKLDKKDGIIIFKGKFEANKSTGKNLDEVNKKIRSVSGLDGRVFLLKSEKEKDLNQVLVSSLSNGLKSKGRGIENGDISL